MRTVFVSSFIVAGLFLARVVQAQGTLYLSNLEQASAGSVAVGINSWEATSFLTGNNDGGYLLDFIQLGMATASENPSSFTVMIYTRLVDSSDHPGSSLGVLEGSANPATADIYTYAPASSFILSPSTIYFIVITAGTSVANGVYEWSLTSPISYGPSGGWGAAGGVWKSKDGSSWLYNSGAPQFAVTATPVPEPSSAWLLLGGSGVLFYVRKRKHHSA